jgi:hypothetical protein
MGNEIMRIEREGLFHVMIRPSYYVLTHDKVVTLLNKESLFTGVIIIIGVTFQTRQL